MAKGVYKTNKKDGSVYYRVSITYKNKHISIGSYDDENTAQIIDVNFAKLVPVLNFFAKKMESKRKYKDNPRWG